MLVRDANILIRAVLGSRALALLRKYAGQVEFLAPDLVFQEARGHLPGILTARKVPAAPAIRVELFLAKTAEGEVRRGSLSERLQRGRFQVQEEKPPDGRLPERM